MISYSHHLLYTEAIVSLWHKILLRYINKIRQKEWLYQVTRRVLMSWRSLEYLSDIIFEFSKDSQSTWTLWGTHRCDLGDSNQFLRRNIRAVWGDRFETKIFCWNPISKNKFTRVKSTLLQFRLFIISTKKHTLLSFSYKLYCYHKWNARFSVVDAGVERGRIIKLLPGVCKFIVISTTRQQITTGSVPPTQPILLTINTAVNMFPAGMFGNDKDNQISQNPQSIKFLAGSPAYIRVKVPKDVGILLDEVQGATYEIATYAGTVAKLEDVIFFLKGICGSGRWEHSGNAPGQPPLFVEECANCYIRRCIQPMDTRPPKLGTAVYNQGVGKPRGQTSTIPQVHQSASEHDMPVLYLSRLSRFELIAYMGGAHWYDENHMACADDQK